MKHELDMIEVKKSFDRTDRISAFTNELTELINRHGIGSLLAVPDYILAKMAVGQMEICASVASGAVGNPYKPVVII